MKNHDTLLGWTAASLIAKLAVDRLADNSMTVHPNDDVAEFVKLSDGTRAPPPGVASNLVENGDGPFSLSERFGTTVDFNADDRISRLTEADGNTLEFTCNTANTVIEDAFGRTITLHHAKGRIESVSGSARRSTSYAYNGDGELTTYMDPESKPWGYRYDDTDHPHRMTGLTDPFGTVTAANGYGNLGRVSAQTVPRQDRPGRLSIYSAFRIS